MRQPLRAAITPQPTMDDAMALAGWVARQVRAGDDEVAQECRIAAWQALESWDAARGVEFRTYAVPRIRWAALGWLRKLRQTSEPTPDTSSSYSPDAEQAIDRRRLVGRILVRLGAAPLHARATWLAKEAHGVSLRDFALAAGVSRRSTCAWYRVAAAAVAQGGRL